MKKCLSVVVTLLLLLTLVFGTSLPVHAATLRTATVTTSILNVRTGPGITYSRITTVTQGVVLPVLMEQAGWVKIQLQDGRTGWISAEFITLRSQQPSQWARVTAGVLNIRSGPGIAYSQITTVSEGAILPVIQMQNGWAQVLHSSGKIGWLSSTYVTFSSTNPAPAPNPQPAPPAPTPTPTPQLTGTVTADVLNVRSGPGITYSRIASVSQNTTLTVLQNSGGWLEVRIPSGQVGWVSAEFVFLPVRDSAPLPDRSGRPSPVAGKVIVIDPGHGGSNPGAIGVTGLMEKIVNLDVSLRVATLLQSAGATVVMTRTSDSYLNLAPRVAIAETAQADVFVSIHANAHLSPSIGGTETYYYQYKASGSQSRYLAQSIQSELARTLGLRNIGIKQGSFHVIRETSMASVLVELAFLSNAREEALMRTDTFRENSAAAIFRGLENYFR